MSSTLPPNEKVRRFLERSGWSTMKLASEAGLHESTVSKIARGDRAITLKSALAIERATKAARDRGELSVAHLRAVDILPAELAKLVAA